MRYFILLAVFTLTQAQAPKAHAQEIPIYSQAEIDAAPACAKGRDLAEGDMKLCRCKANGFDHFVWGTGPYSGHSDICTAARHTGVITKEEGGVIVAVGRAGQSAYAEGEANGIKGRRWGIFRNSFDVAQAKTDGAASENISTRLPACQGFLASAAPYDCACPAGTGNGGAVWGSGPYTGDSDLCSAARHSGAVSATGGVISVTAQPGQTSYVGSSENGVTSSDWGPYGQSFMPAPQFAFEGATQCEKMPSGVETLQCNCPARGDKMGAVWGSGPYTADSDICTAARHAGVISDAGGNVEVWRVIGLQSYRASAAHGVVTTNWDRFDSSIIFNRN